MAKLFLKIVLALNIHFNARHYKNGESKEYNGKTEYKEHTDKRYLLTQYRFKTVQITSQGRTWCWQIILEFSSKGKGIVDRYILVREKGSEANSPKS